MKRILAAAVVLLMVVVGTTFASGTSEKGGAKASSAVQIGYCVPDTTNPFLGWLTSTVKKKFAAEGIRVQVADAASSTVTQLQQIQNFIAMHVKVLDIMPVDPNSVKDVIKKAMGAGIQVLVAGTDTGVYSVMENIDQYNDGQQIAQMAMTWMDKTFSSNGKDSGLPTGANKLKVLVLKDRTTLDSNHRSQGIIDEITKWGKVDVVVAPGDVQTLEAASAAMENMWQQNSKNMVAVLAYNSSDALAANEFVMRQAGVDKAKFGVYCGDWSPAVQKMLDESLTNQSVFRGAMNIVGPKIDGKQVPLDQATYMIMTALLKGEKPYGNFVPDTIAKTYGKVATSKTK